MSCFQGRAIADGLKLSLGYAQQLLDGVTSEAFARFAAPGGELVESNHPAFIYGHLSLYSPRIIQFCGGQAEPIPEGFNELFSNKAKCQDDVDGSIYPEMQQITDFFFDGHNAALEVVQGTDDEVLNQSNPAPGPMAEKFPTVGSMCNFISAAHIMLHMGQMSAWRRMQGLGSAS